MGVVCTKRDKTLKCLEYISFIFLSIKMPKGVNSYIYLARTMVCISLFCLQVVYPTHVYIVVHVKLSVPMGSYAIADRGTTANNVNWKVRYLLLSLQYDTWVGLIQFVCLTCRINADSIRTFVIFFPVHPFKIVFLH